MHKNSQKRIYDKGLTYFITFNTKERYPFFAPDQPNYNVLCELFILELKLAKELKNFELYGMTIMYDHVHLLIKPSEKFNISQIVHGIKRHFARDANTLICPTNNFRSREGEDSYPRLQIQSLQALEKYIDKYRKSSLFEFVPKFQWHKSFHDHIVRDEKDFILRLNYIANNHFKHSSKYDYPINWNYVFPNTLGDNFSNLFC